MRNILRFVVYCFSHKKELFVFCYILHNANTVFQKHVNKAMNIHVFKTFD